MTAIVFALPGNETLARELAAMTGAEHGTLEYRKFPDRESYLRFVNVVHDRASVLACSLNDPNSKTVELFLAAEALRALGANQVGLAAPYLAYLRQDRRFKEGEAITSIHFARLLSSTFDWIATIDPHLHRWKSASEIYSVPVLTGHATPVVVAYLRARREPMFLIGPDEESEQWAGAIASAAAMPHVTLRKERRGDRDVVIDIPGLHDFVGRKAVLIDDIISSGRTMEVAMRQLIERGFESPVCLATHGVLADDSYSRLVVAGAEVVTTNSIPGPAARLDINPILADLVKPRLQERI
jgi:ribose-phosphate pyrophosphokinase